MKKVKNIPLHDYDNLNSLFHMKLPWSPLDFIDKISAEGDKGLFVDRITSKLNRGNDLRFVYQLDNGDQLAIFAEKLPWDTEFFGYGVGKIYGIFPISEPYYRPGGDYAEAIGLLIQLAKDKNIKYLFANVDSRDLALMRSLGEMGFSLIETRAYYHQDISNYEYKERYQVRAAKEEDIERLGSAAVEMVNMYDRFHSDPFISRTDADRLMYKWVEASIAENFADITIVPDYDKPTAFCTVKYHRNNWEQWGVKISQPIFSAVGPAFKGWYRKLISEVIFHLKDIGAEHCYLTTQTANSRVIWVWESLRFHFGKGEHVFRIIL